MNYHQKETLKTTKLWKTTLSHYRWKLNFSLWKTVTWVTWFS